MQMRTQKTFSLNLKQFKTIKMVIVVVLAILVSQSIIMRNFLWPIMGTALATAILLYLRRHVKEIIADERDYEIGGIAARWSIQIFIWTAVIAMFILYAQRDLNPSYEIVASVLAYSACFLMFVYSMIFNYHEKISFLKNRNSYIVIAIMILLLFLLAGLRLFSGEDDWICTNGTWIKHGNPSFPAPAIQCDK